MCPAFKLQTSCLCLSPEPNSGLSRRAARDCKRVPNINKCVPPPSFAQWTQKRWNKTLICAKNKRCLNMRGSTAAYHCRAAAPADRNGNAAPKSEASDHMMPGSPPRGIQTPGYLFP